MKYKLSEKKIIIYGAASYGKRIYQRFSDNGYEIAYFMDKRADELLEFLGKKVISPLENIEESTMIFIAVKNVFEHSKIARSFLERGINNIVFRPYAVLMGRGNETQKELNRVYDSIDKNQFELIGHIPAILEDELFQLYDASLICEESNSVVVRIPWQFVFTNISENKSSIWSEVNVAQQFPHISFFSDLLGKKENGIDEYLNFCVNAAILQGDINITDAWKKNVLTNREMVFNQMNMAYELDSYFFVRNAPTADWNAEKGYFNLTSGKHRVAFLFSKGIRYIPLRVSRNDYSRFINTHLAEEIYRYGDRVYGYRILNPLFLQMPQKNAEFYDRIERVLYDTISRIIYERSGKISLQGYSFLVNACDDGSLARTFSKCGMWVERIVRDKDIALIKKIDSLMFCNENLVTENKKMESTDMIYDFVLERVERDKVCDVEKGCHRSNIATFFICESDKFRDYKTNIEIIFEGIYNLRRVFLCMYLKK